MLTYMEVESTGKETLFVFLRSDLLSLSFMTNKKSPLQNRERKKEQTETKDPKPTTKEPQMSNFKEYHRRALLGTVPAL